MTTWPTPATARIAQLSAAWMARSASAFRRPELASRSALTPWQSNSLGMADTLHDGDRSQRLLPRREHTARAAVPPAHLPYPRTTRGHLSCDLTSGQVTEWRRGGPKERPGAETATFSFTTGGRGRILSEQNGPRISSAFLPHQVGRVPTTILQSRNVVALHSLLNTFIKVFHLISPIILST